MTESPDGKVDRLAAFFRAFDMSVLGNGSDETGEAAHMVVEYGPAGPERIVLHPHGAEVPPPAASATVTIAVCFGGAANPLLSALPDRVTVDLADEPVLAGVVSALIAEMEQKRCGRQIGLDRLSQVVVLMMLRQAIDRGASRPGLLAGLTHPSLRRAVVAMHDQPGRAWRVEDLAALAGQSRSQFMKAFPQVVGMTPAAYLTEWRLAVARRDLARGGAIKTVARRVGFGSAEAFSRAFSRRFGCPPSQLARI